MFISPPVEPILKITRRTNGAGPAYMSLVVIGIALQFSAKASLPPGTITSPAIAPFAAIARANRVNEGKENGLIVNYCGILKNLRKALATFAGTHDTGHGGTSGTADPAQPEEDGAMHSWLISSWHPQPNVWRPHK
jgi:hypothetical protein